MDQYATAQQSGGATNTLQGGHHIQLVQALLQLREQPKNTSQTPVLSASPNLSPVYRDNTNEDSRHGPQLVATGHQEVVSFNPDAIRNPSSVQDTPTLEEGNSGVVNDRQVLRFKFPELLKYLSTLPEYEQRQTIELIRLLKARKLKQNEENNVTRNTNAASSMQIKQLSSSMEEIPDVQRTAEKMESSQTSQPVAFDEKQGTGVTQDCDPTKHGEEIECPARCPSPVATNSRWQQHLSKAVNTQRVNAEDESHNSMHEQQVTTEKQSIKSELLELIRKTCSFQGSGQHYNRETTEQKVFPSEGNSYQTIGSAQEMNVCTSPRMGDAVNRGTDTDRVIPSTSNELVKIQDTHIVGNFKTHESPAHVVWQPSERKEIPHLKSDGVCFQQQMQCNPIPMPMKTLPDTNFSPAPTPDSVIIPHQMSIGEAGNGTIPETSLTLTSPVFTTRFFSPNNMSPQEITLVSQPEGSELTEQPYTFINAQTSNENMLSGTSNETVIKQQNDGLVSEHMRRPAQFANQVAPQQLQPLQTVQLPYTIQNVAQHVLQPVAVQGPSVLELQEDLNGMRRLIDELKSEVKDLKERVEKKSPNETVVKLTNLVNELKNENSYLKEQLIKIVMSPKKENPTDVEIVSESAKKSVTNEEVPKSYPRSEQWGSSDEEDDGLDPVSQTSESSEMPAHEELKDERRKTRHKVKAEPQFTDEDNAKRTIIGTSTAKKFAEETQSTDIKTEDPINSKVNAPTKKGKSSLTYDSLGKICCTACDKKFVHSSSYYYHLKKHKGDRPYKCTYCSKSFYNSTQLKCHERIHTGEKPFPCVICRKRFTEVNQMKKHMSTVHTDSKVHQCDRCDKAYKNARDLRNHLKTHDAPDGKPFVCKGCNKRFVCERYARICVKSHGGNMPFICMSCGKDFKSSETLRMHEQIHQDKATHKCNFCDKTFKQQPSLYTHMKTHTRMNMYKCQMCSKEFITKYRLKNHLMRHNGERPRKCKLCNKGFVESHELARHMRVHNDISPYACKFCDRTFKDNSNLAQHEKTHGIKKKLIKSDSGKGVDNSQTIEREKKADYHSEDQGEVRFGEGQLVTGIFQTNASVDQQLLRNTQPINVEILTCEGSSAPSVQYQPSISVMSLPSQTQLTVNRSEILGNQSSSNLVIMDSSSDGTSVLDLDSGLTSHSK